MVESTRLSCGFAVAGLLAAGLVYPTHTATAQAVLGCPTITAEQGALLFTAREGWDLLTKRGCREVARKLASQLLIDSKDRFGMDSPELADAYDLSSFADYWLGRRDEVALTRAREAVRIRRLHKQDAPAALARSLRIIAAHEAVKHEESFYLEALAHYEEAHELWTGSLGFESVEVVDLLAGLADLVNDWGTEGSSRALAIPWLAELFDPNKANSQRIRSELRQLNLDSKVSVGLESQRKDPALVVALLSAALGREVDPVSPEFGEALNIVGTILNHRQFFDEALTVFEECLEVRLRAYAETPGHPQIARSYHNRGLSLVMVGHLDEAAHDLEVGLEMRASLFGLDSKLLGTSLFALGEVEHFRGRQPRAIALYEDAVPRIRLTHGQRNTRHVWSLIRMAEAYEELGELDKAEESYRTAFEALNSGDDSQTEDSGLVRTRLGSFLAHRPEADQARAEENLEEGRRLLAEAWEIQENRLATVPAENQAATYHALAELAELDGNLKRTVALYRQAVSLLEGYEEIHPRLMDALMSLARAELDNGLYREAGETLGRAGEVDLPEAAYLSRSQYHFLRARLLRVENRPREALVAAIRAARLYSANLEPALAVLPPTSAVRYVSRGRESLEIALELLPASNLDENLVEEVWAIVAATRGLALSELSRRYSSARNSEDAELSRRLQDVRQARKNLAMAQVRALATDSMEESRAILEYASRRVRDTERSLALRSSQGAKRTVEIEDDVGAPVTRVPQGWALVSFVRSGGGEPNLAKPAFYGAFVVPERGRRAIYLRLGDAERIDRSVDGWRTALLDFQDLRLGGAALEREGRALEELIWSPVVDILGGAKRVLIVPDGSLYLFPFSALPGRKGEYLVDDGYEFHRVASERDLRESQSKNS